MLIFVKHEMKGKAMNMLTVKEKEALQGDIVERAESLLAGITPGEWAAESAESLKIRAPHGGYICMMGH